MMARRAAPRDAATPAFDPLMRQELFLAGDAGPLEALLECEHEPPFRRVAVVCHPHPLHGGTMNTTVVHRMAKGLRREGYATLRFNFRGVGQSAGVHDEGRGERADAATALEHLLRAEHTGGAPKSVVMAGFSFGSRFGLEAGVADPRVDLLIGVGMPLRKYDFGFLERSRKPKLLLLGDRDEFVPAPEFESFARRCAQPVDWEVLADSDHLFTRRAHLVEDAIASWLRRREL
ncbi:MAG: alpha/beta hydrolase [Planctomycetes bacterium]|nr:alpha/beta hydrolase [Planctomycetota bacterium]